MDVERDLPGGHLEQRHAVVKGIVFWRIQSGDRPSARQGAFVQVGLAFKCEALAGLRVALKRDSTGRTVSGAEVSQCHGNRPGQVLEIRRAGPVDEVKAAIGYRQRFDKETRQGGRGPGRFGRLAGFRDQVGDVQASVLGDHEPAPRLGEVDLPEIPRPPEERRQLEVRVELAESGEFGTVVVGHREAVHRDRKGEGVDVYLLDRHGALQRSRKLFDSHVAHDWRENQESGDRVDE
jgi:hypothetical protein